jgi:peroxiredoxin
LKVLGLNAVAIMSNNPEEYRADSFGNMQKIAKEMAFPFPYLIDETQEIAKAYGAVCTKPALTVTSLVQQQKIKL